MRPHGTPEELERRRMRAIRLLQEGRQPVEVAPMVGVDRRSVRRWNATFRKDGMQSLKHKKAAGRPQRLSDKQKQQLAKALLKGAQAHGFQTDLWTCPRVALLIKKRFAVRYHVDHIGRLLHGMGFSPQKPQRRAIERDEKEIRRWIKEEWPKIKKKPVA